MTVKELIAALTAQPNQEAEVFFVGPGGNGAEVKPENVQFSPAEHGIPDQLYLAVNPEDILEYGVTYEG